MIEDWKSSKTLDPLQTLKFLFTFEYLRKDISNVLSFILPLCPYNSINLKACKMSAHLSPSHFVPHRMFYVTPSQSTILQPVHSPYAGTVHLNICTNCCRTYTYYVLCIYSAAKIKNKIGCQDVFGRPPSTHFSSVFVDTLAKNHIRNRREKIQGSE